MQDVDQFFTESFYRSLELQLSFMFSSFIVVAGYYLIRCETLYDDGTEMMTS